MKNLMCKAVSAVDDFVCSYRPGPLRHLWCHLFWFIIGAACSVWMGGRAGFMLVMAADGLWLAGLFLNFVVFPYHQGNSMFSEADFGMLHHANGHLSPRDIFVLAPMALIFTQAGIYFSFAITTAVRTVGLFWNLFALLHRQGAAEAA